MMRMLQAGIMSSAVHLSYAFSNRNAFRLWSGHSVTGLAARRRNKRVRESTPSGHGVTGPHSGRVISRATTSYNARDRDWRCRPLQ